MKKIIALLLCLLMVVGMVACGSEETAAPAETDAPVVEGDRPYEGMELNVWTAYVEGTPAWEAANEYIAKFEAKTGAKINVAHYGTDLGTILPTALGAGEEIDVFPLGSQNQLQAQIEHTLDLTDYINNSDYLERAYPIYMESIEEYGGIEGEWHAIPTVCSYNAFWYNKAAFEAAGITEVPETMEEFEAACEALIAAGYNPIAQDSAYIGSIFGALVQRMVGEDVVADLCWNGGFAENEQFVAACDRVLDWVDRGFFDPNSPGEWPASQNKIGLTEENVMVFCGAWVSGEIEEMTGTSLDWGCFKFPRDPEGTNSYATTVSCTCNAINSAIDPEKADLAWEYIYYMCTGEADKAITDADVYVVNDRTMEPLPRFVEAKELLENTTEDMNYIGGLHANPDIKTSIADTILGLYTGLYADGAEAAAAFDALVG